MNITEMLIDEEETIINVMKLLGQTSAKVLFIVKDEVLQASVTDGDVRRWILNKGSLDARVKKIANYSPLFLRQEERKEAQEFMRRKSIQAVPIVDNEKRILSIILWDKMAIHQTRSRLNCPVVIMAGGKGTRLAPFTQVLPKPLIPIGEKTITEHIMDRFESYGCNQFNMIVNYKKNLIKAYFSDTDVKRNVVFTEETDYLGTGGGLRLLINMYKEPFFFTNCDILIDDDYAKIHNFHKNNNNLLTMVCAEKKIVVPYGVVKVNQDSTVTELQEKPDFSVLTNTGFYVVEPKFINEIPDNTFIHLTDIIQKCLDDNKKIGMYLISEDAWMDMGHMEEMEKMGEKLRISEV